MFMNKRQIISAYNNGHLDEVANQLRRYGTITKDVKWEVDEGHYKGDNRIMFITLHGMSWELDMVRGEVKTVGIREFCIHKHACSSFCHPDEDCTITKDGKCDIQD